MLLMIQFHIRCQNGKRGNEMNSLFILLFAAVALMAGYLLYGRWLAKTWGVDPKADTPAVRHNDGKDYAPASRLTVFAHQFSSIAGAGPVQGPILAAVFGWVPALLWLLIGGIFFGAVQDFSALYASVKNDGKSIGLIIEKYIGKKGRKFFTLFCWLFSLLVIAAFTSMTSSTFNGFVTGSDGAVTQNFNGAAAATISFLFVGCAIVFGLIQKKFPNLKEWHKIVISLAFIVFMFAAGMKMPVYLTASQWNYVIMAYLFIAAVAPMWLLMQPRDYMTTFMFLGMIIGGVVGVFTGHPEMKLNAFNGFVLTSDAGAKTYMFPTLFVTVACGAISGFHSLVSSGTSSKTVSNENDMLPVGYGAMILETLLGVISLIVVGAVAVNGAVPSGLTPFQIFSQGVAGFLENVGIPASVANVFMTMCISALAFSTLDSVGRIGRLSFQELFTSDDEDSSSMEESCYKPVLCYSNYIIFRICIMLRRLFKRMGIIWKCQPVTWCSCIDLYCCIHESNKQTIMDVLFSYDLHGRRYAVSSTVSVPCVTTQPATSSLRRVSRICPARLNMSAGVI